MTGRLAASAALLDGPLAAAEPSALTQLLEFSSLGRAAADEPGAEAAGLAYVHLPIPSRRPDEAALAAFAKALAELPRPVYACCYSGARTAAAWALTAASHHEPASIIEACATAGFDIEFLRDTLAARRADALAPVPRAGGATAATFIAATESTAPVPQLKPSVLTPRAASVGGFAVAG